MQVPCHSLGCRVKVAASRTNTPAGRAIAFDFVGGRLAGGRGGYRPIRLASVYLSSSPLIPRVCRRASSTGASARDLEWVAYYVIDAGREVLFQIPHFEIGLREVRVGTYDLGERVTGRTRKAGAKAWVFCRAALANAVPLTKRTVANPTPSAMSALRIATSCFPGQEQHTALIGLRPRVRQKWTWRLLRAVARPFMM